MRHVDINQQCVVANPWLIARLNLDILILARFAMTPRTRLASLA